MAQGIDTSAPKSEKHLPKSVDHFFGADVFALGRAIVPNPAGFSGTLSPLSNIMYKTQVMIGPFGKRSYTHNLSVLPHVPHTIRLKW